MTRMKTILAAAILSLSAPAAYAADLSVEWSSIKAPDIEAGDPSRAWRKIRRRSLNCRRPPLQSM